MSERTVTLKTSQQQRSYGDTFYRAEVDFHLRESDFGGAPAAEVAIATVKLLWPAATNVELSARPAPTAKMYSDGHSDRADRWIVRGAVSYCG